MPGESRWSLPRVLFLAGVLAAVAAVVSWVAVGSGGSSSDDAGGGCRVPSHASSGTEPPPELITTVAAPLGAPEVTFTQTSGDTTVYGYCFDVVDGQTLGQVVALMRSQPYTSQPGGNPTQQLNFTAPGATPYGVSLSVGGNLDIGNPRSGEDGSVSIVWTNDTGYVAVTPSSEPSRDRSLSVLILTRRAFRV